MAFRNLNRVAAGGLVLAGALGFIACGGGATTSAAGSTGTVPQTATTPMQVSLGDAPADWIMAFGMKVNGITLTSTTGATVNVVPASANTEMMQLQATVQPVASMNVPQGSYTQAKVTVSAISMGYMDPVSHAYTQKTLAGPFTATVPFSPAMTVGSSPVALNFDMNMGASVATDASGNPSFSPVMTAAMASVSSGAANPWQGGMQHQVGSVSGVSGSSFTLSSMMGLPSATFTTNGSTQFPATGLPAMGMMTSGMMVAVDASLQPDGTYLAQRVEYMGVGATGGMGGGLVTAITGNPPTQLTVTANAGQGAGMMASSIAGTFTVALPANAPYSIDSDGVDLSGIPFAATFDASTLVKGQRVDVVSATGMMSSSGGMGGGMTGSLGTLTATQVRLEPQALHGTASAITPGGSLTTFTLTLPSDSAFATLAGTTTVQVYQPASAHVMGQTAVANGADVQARGLLFYDAGTYKLVVGWLAAH